ncbi:hypothetical protein HanRHA438_Chr03g0105981 [Helianthus annuus]|nr:hypothetical protein HanRHA438_Chr03g0105981 [Helianthus annuus]
MILLTLGIALFYTLSIGITSILVVNSWAVWFIGAITLSIPLCYFYVATLWMVSLIVSVLEDGSTGLKAIGRASELMKGKRLQASLMMVLFAIAYGLVIMMANFLISYNRSLTAELAITIPFTNGFYTLLKLFMFVVYTVSYHEWKTSHEEKEGKAFTFRLLLVTFSAITVSAFAYIVLNKGSDQIFMYQIVVKRIMISTDKHLFIM